MRSGLSLLAGAAMLVALARWFGVDDVVAALRAASPAGLLGYAALSLAILLLQAGRWGLVAAAVGAATPLPRLAAARLAGDGVAALLPLARVSGDPLRAVLARTGDTRLSSATAGVAIDRLLELLGNLLAVVAYVGVFSVATVDRAAPRASLAVGAAVLVPLALLALLVVQLARGNRPLAPLYGPRARRWAPRHGHWLDGLRRVEEHLAGFFRAHRLTFLVGLGGTVLIELLVILQYRALLGAFGVELALPALLMVLLGGGVARALPTPAALGALEAAQVLVVGASTGRADLGFVVGVIVRLHETLLILVGLATLSALGFSPTRLPAVPQVPAR
jgi:uncharacterized protein (TIRG00374 family)